MSQHRKSDFIDIVRGIQIPLYKEMKDKGNCSKYLRCKHFGGLITAYYVRQQRTWLEKLLRYRSYSLCRLEAVGHIGRDFTSNSDEGYVNAKEAEFSNEHIENVKSFRYEFLSSLVQPDGLENEIIFK